MSDTATTCVGVDDLGAGGEGEEEREEECEGVVCSVRMSSLYRASATTPDIPKEAAPFWNIVPSLAGGEFTYYLSCAR
jgi:hypothetical protein